MSKDLTHLSKFLSLVLRHKPEAIGITLDAQGWVTVDELLRAANQAGRKLTRPLLDQIVTENDKQRFAFSEDRLRIRASQGHSVEVELALDALQPPDQLYHGTASRFLTAIRQEGLTRQSRNHVHLSADEQTAIKVGQRHGKPVVLVVDAGRMYTDGLHFYHSANGVWLTEHVPVDYLHFPA